MTLLNATKTKIKLEQNTERTVQEMETLFKERELNLNRGENEFSWEDLEYKIQGKQWNYKKKNKENNTEVLETELRKENLI